MMSLKLIKLTKTYEKQLGEMIDEWKADQALNHTNHSPWAICDILPPLSLTLRSGGFLFDSPYGLRLYRLSPRVPRF